MFGRKGRNDAAAETSDRVDRHDDVDVLDPAAGPYDLADAPDDEVGRIDLGALRIPVYEGLEMRLEVDPSGQVVGVTLDNGSSAMQLAAFAAPRKQGIWTEFRMDLMTSLRAGGGTAREVEGGYGVELVAEVPTTPDGGGLAPARFVGVDGPRWFLHAVLSGDVAAAAVAADSGIAAEVPGVEVFDDVLRRVVVVRGDDAMPMRDPLPLRLPKEALEPTAAGGPVPADFDPTVRGPEITEVY